ncbi:MAG: lipid-A-disaccharide synthase [Gammaproteobacteria bacterium]|nr:lipid-A-disaccharide synthase [Gammaproteobacteria bacterium]
MTGPIHLGIVAGEKSGDILGAGLMRALRDLYPAAHFSGVGGPEMERLGCDSLAPMERLSVMGLVEPLGRLPELLRIKRRLERFFLKTRPAAFIGIDSPDFNLRLSGSLHKRGIRTIHYVSPSVWAWRKGRIHGIARSIDLMLTLFPFETDIYREHGVRVQCVGHPLADEIGLEDGGERARRELSLDPAAPVIALMPGSRKSEIRRMAPEFLAAASAAQDRFPELRFLVPCSGAENRRLLEEIIAQGGFAGAEIRLLDRSHQAIAAADFVILASGTASLEAMLLRRPMVACYKLAPLSYALASRIVKVDHMAIPNLLAGERLVPEYVQNDVNGENLLREIERFMENRAPRKELLEKFAQQHRFLRRNASAQAAGAIHELLTGQAHAS